MIYRDKNINTIDAIVSKNLTQHDIPTTGHSQRYPVTEDNTRLIRTFVNTVRNAAHRNINYSGSWRVPDSLWREAMLEKQNIYKELMRRGQANMRIKQN